MAIKVNFIDNDVIYYSADFNRQFNSLIMKNGLLRSKKDFLVTETEPASMKVTVSGGSAFYDGMYIYSDSPVSLDIPRNNSSGNRIDSIILEIDPVGGDVRILHLMGKVNKAPDLRDYQLLIANITVPQTVSTGDLSIRDDQIIMTTDYVFMSKEDIKSMVNSL